MNSITGSWGDGKLTSLEYIQFPLSCPAIDDSTPSSSAVTRFRKILEGILNSQNGEITLEALLNGAPLKLTRQIVEKNVSKAARADTQLKILGCSSKISRNNLN
jgi:hypothetical protein